MVFHKKPFFLQRFAINWVKALKEFSLHKKCLVLAKSTRFGSFSQIAILFATFC